MNVNCKYSNKFTPLVESWIKEMTDGTKTEDDVIQLLSDHFSDNPRDLFHTVVGRYPTGGSTTVVDNPILIETKQNSNKFDRTNDTTKTHYSGKVVEYNNMIRKFKSDIVSRSIFDKDKNQWIDANAKESGKKVNILNLNLAKYKIELLNNIKRYLGDSIFTYSDSELEYMTDSIFTDKINKTLNDFEKRITITEGEIYQKALDSYVILTRFNELLEENTPFVKRKKEYDNTSTQSVDMYDYVGANVQHYTGWSQTQDVSIDDQTSDLLKVLLDYFQEVDETGRPIPNSSIGQAGFNSAMMSLKSAMFYDSELRKMYEQELYKGAQMNLSKVITQYLAYLKTNLIDTNYRTFLTNKLRGINNYIFNNDIDPAIKSMFIAQFNKTVSVRYRNYILDFSEGGIRGRNLKEQLINAQSYNIQDIIKNSINTYRNDQSYFQKILDRYDVKIDPQSNTISFYGGKYKINISSTFGGTSDKYDFTVEGELTHEELQKLVSDLTSFWVPDEFEQVGLSLRPKMAETSWNEARAFAPILALTIMGSYNEGKNYEFKQDKYGLVNIYSYLRDLQSVAEINSVIFGADTINVIRDSKGNNLPLFQLTSLVYNWANLIHDIEYDENRYKKYEVYVENIYSQNILFKNKQIVNPPVTRSDIVVRDRVKNPSELTVPEVMRLSILYDFYREFKSNSGHIYLQNTTFSDKVRHYLQDYNINTIISGPQINGKTQYTLREIIAPAIQSGNSEALFNLFFQLENDKINRAVNNLLNIYSKVFGVNFNTLEELDNWLSIHTESFIKAGFKSSGIPLTEQFHYVKINGKLRVNEVMYNWYKRYGDSKNKSLAKKYIDSQRRRFIYGLLKDGFKLNIFNDATLQEFGQDYSTWVDKNSGDIQIAHLYKDGKEVSFGIDYDMLLDDQYEIKLHPVFEAYLMTDGLLSTQYNSLLVGEVWAHPNKNKEGINPDGTLSDDYYTFSEANRLVAQNKRATIFGATVHPFLQNLHDGVAERIKVAVLNDIKGEVWTITGEQNDIDSMDGSGLSSIYQAIFENKALLDAAVALDKKTIMHTMDAITGMQEQLKWAVYAITNERRRTSWGSNLRLENLHKKMHNIFLGKDIDIQSYFKSQSDDIYFKDWETQKYYKILEFSDTYNYDTDWLVVDRTIIEVDKNGEVLPGAQPITNTWSVNTIYDIDQLFGGAWAMARKTDRKELDYSDNNNYLVAKIIADEGLKDKFISYAVNKSAVKVGATNVNSDEVWYDDSKLQYMDFSTKFGGVQMNADHELDYAEVTEMSQMISSFIQNGYTKDIALQAYREIGEVAADSIKDFKDAIIVNDRETVYKILGKALVQAFNTGSKDTLGLAQSFLREAEKGLKDANLEYTIPFSAPTIRGAFMATVTSTLNKRGIRRKYEGLAGVLTPSNDMIQYYQLGDKTYGFEAFAKEINRVYGKQQFFDDYGNSISAVKYFINNNDVENNKLIERLNTVNDIDFEDTVIIERKNTETGEIIREKPIKIDNFWKYELIKHDPTIVNIWKHNGKPRNLKGQELYFTINTNNGPMRFTLYDLDSVRAAQYVRKAIKDERELTSNELALVARSIPISNPDGTIKDGFQLIKDLNAATQRTLDRLQTKKSIAMQQAFEGYVTPSAYFDVTNIDSRGAQIIVGRRYARQFGLKHGDSLADIKSDPDWFNKRMRDTYKFPNIAKNDIYDVVLYRTDGKPVLVKFSSKDNFSAIADDTIAYENDAFRIVDDIVFYNGEELGNSDGKQLYKYTDKNSKESYDLIVLNNPDNFEELMNSGLFDTYRYNYTEANYKTLLEREFGDEEQIELQIAERGKSKFKTYDITDPEIVYGLIDNEKIEFNRRINVAAKNKRDAFFKSLQFVGARIPTQSMQSFTALEVVEFSDTDTNSIYIPKKITYLEGSDYDIDKQYVLGFSISDNGKLQTMSNLQSEFGISIDEVNKLPKPNGIKYSEDSTSPIRISIQELQQVTGMLHKDLFPGTGQILRSLDPFIRILNSDIDSIAFEAIDTSNPDRVLNYNKAKRKFIKMLNKHSLTKLSKFSLEQALKNQVVQRALDITLDPRNQVNLQIPIAMTQVQTAAKKSTMGKDERYISSFNPHSKYMMQYQNMVGKQVIGIGAVSMKVYFAIQTYMDRMFDEMIPMLEAGNYGEVIGLIDKLTIEHPLTGELAILANINLDNQIDYLNEHGITYISAGLIGTSDILSKYVTSEGFNLKQCLLDIQTIARTTDGAETLSEIISSATDNAKELTLAKINCTSKFADIYTYLVSIGTPFTEITKIMMSPIFNQVAKMAETDIFDSNTYNFNLKSALEFYTNKKQLPFVDSQVLLHVLSDSYLNELDVNEETKNSILTTIQNSTGKTLVEKAMAGTLKNNDLNVLILKLKTQINKIANSQRNDDEEIEDFFSQMEIEDFYDFDETNISEDEYSDDIVRRNWSTNPITIRELRNVVTLFEYCKSRNEQIEYLNLHQDSDSKSVEEQLEDLILLTNDILPGMEEQRTMGSILGINQGMKTNAYDKYKYIQNIENFINKRITAHNKTTNDNFVRFDLMRFLSDETYRNDQIRQYNSLKSTYNILEAITKVPHFNEMFNILYVDDWLIHKYSVHNTLVKKLSNEVLLNKDTKLSQKEYKTVQQYVGDIIILNALMGSDLKFKIPKGVGRFTGYRDDTWSENAVIETIPLNSMEALATFKKIMDSYIIPMLKNPELFPNETLGINMARYSENEFIKSLSRGVIGDSRSGRVKSFWRIGQLNMMQIDASQKTQMEYEKILTDFNKIKDDIINGWRIADLFYLYNLVTNKDSFGKSSMTRLFEDLVSAGDKSLLVNQFYNFMSKLDLAEDKDQLIYDINDLKFRLANTTNSKDRFGSYKLGNTIFVNDASEQTLDFIDPSYFTFDMPYLRGQSIKHLRKGIVQPIPKDNVYEVRLDSQEALYAIGNEFNRKAKDLPFKFKTEQEIYEEFPEDNRAHNANAFIHNGQVYINLNKAKIDAPLHEFTHLVLAQLRMDNPTEYYKWLNTTINHPDFNTIAEAYPNLTGSDLQEEVFAKVLSDLFNNIVSTKYDPSYVFASQNQLLESINNLFKSEIPTDTDILELMKTPMDQILYQFLSKLFNFDSSINSFKVLMSQRLSTAKYKWIKEGMIKENCE